MEILKIIKLYNSKIFIKIIKSYQLLKYKNNIN